MAALSAMAFDGIRSVGADIVIFIVTLLFALAIRRIPQGKQKGDRSTPKSAKYACNSSDRSPSAAVPKSGSGRQLDGPRCDATNAFQRGGLDANADTPQPVSAFARAERRRLPWQLINEVVDGMREQPGTRFAARALALYAELKALLKKDGYRIAEVARGSRYSTLDFYTTLVQCTIRLEKYHLIEGIIDDMTVQGVVRPIVFYESAMKQLAGQKHYHLALNMYDRLVADGLEASAVTCSCLINFAAEVGELDRALSFFKKLSTLTVPSIRAYMTVLRVHAKRQDWKESVTIFRDMQARGVRLDSLVLNVILATGVAADQIDGVEALLNEADCMQPPISDVVSYNTLVKGFAQRNDSVGAAGIIERMRKRGLKPNAITFNTVMDAAVRSQQAEFAWDLLQDMRSAGLRPDKYTCSILIKGLTKTATPKHILAALDLLHEVDGTCDANLRPALYHAVVESAAQASDTSMLLEAFSRMRRHQVVPSNAAYRLLVQALGQEGDVARCCQAWHQMIAEDVQPRGAVFGALLESHLRKGQVGGAMSAYESLRAGVKTGACEGRARTHPVSTSLLEECCVAFIRHLCRSGNEPEATRVYLQAKDDETKIDLTTGLILSKAQAESGDIAHSWSTIEDMMELGHKPSDAALHALISACVKQSQTAIARHLLDKAAKKGFALSQPTYVNILKLYGKCQHLTEAITIFEDMTERQQIDPSPQVLATMLHACFQSRQPDTALDLLENFHKRSAPAPLDGTVYRAAISGCAVAGLHDKVVSILKEAIRLGADLPPDTLAGVSTATRRQRSPVDLQALRELADANGLALGPLSAGDPVSLRSSSEDP